MTAPAIWTRQRLAAALLRLRYVVRHDGDDFRQPRAMYAIRAYQRLSRIHDTGAIRRALAEVEDLLEVRP